MRGVVWRRSELVVEEEECELRYVDGEWVLAEYEWWECE